MTIKQLLTGASLAAAMTLGLSAPASAADFLFSFTNNVGNVAGTVTGEVFGLVDNATSSATKVEVFTWPSALIPPANQPFYPSPVDATSWASQFANTFTVAGGVVVSGDFHADNSTAVSSLDRLYLNDSSCACSFLSLGSSDSQYVWSSPNGTTFTPATVPEPATWAVMLLGFGGLGVALRARRGRELAKA